MSSPSASAVSARHGAILPVVVVALVIAIVVFGGYAVNGMLSSPTGPSVEVGGVVRVQPLSGWELVGRFEDPPGVRLTRGSGSLDVVAAPFSGSARDLAAQYVQGVLEPEADRLWVSSQAEPVQLASGLQGVRLAYFGRSRRSQTPIEGEITAVVSPTGVGVVFNAWGPTGVLRYITEDARAMMNAAEVA
jgi:hypothetical protein